MHEQAQATWFALFTCTPDLHDRYPCLCGVEAAYCARHGEYTPARTTEPHGPRCQCRGADGCGGGRRVLRKVTRSLAE